MALLLCLLTAIAFPVVLLSQWEAPVGKNARFLGLMLLIQSGLMGVFCSADALLFYFFWELVLIPSYFLCSIWGGERRIPVTFKFFIYTFIGSVLMLVGLLFLYFKTPDRSFALQSFLQLNIPIVDQNWLFWVFFLAFAIKMPLFPFHTWQPDTYEQAPAATTMVLSGIMVKMGVFGVLRWLAPVIPAGFWSWGDSASFLAMFGMIYASLLAILQDDLKRLIAYSSIAHVGLMALAIFSSTDTGLQGVMIQMFSHGVNVIGLWIVADSIERKTGTRKISELGGLAQRAPVLSILLMVTSLANIALPLTNAFAGEFLMFTGIFTSNVSLFNYIYVAVAGISIILSAVYTLNMIQRVFFGELSPAMVTVTDIRLNERVALGILAALILVFGVYPQPMLDLTADSVQAVLQRMITKHP
jgi:NADH-quinone oxidoreductase subunit M